MRAYQTLAKYDDVRVRLSYNDVTVFNMEVVHDLEFGQKVDINYLEALRV